jgi:hypothetical protein
MSSRRWTSEELDIVADAYFDLLAQRLNAGIQSDIVDKSHRGAARTHTTTLDRSDNAIRHQFHALSVMLADAELPWLHDIRESSFDRYRVRGAPRRAALQKRISARFQREHVE